MKKSAIIITLLMACHLTACSSAVQEPPIVQKQPEQSLPASTEIATVADSVSTFSETTYSEILTTYARALSEKWDGSSLMESNIDTHAGGTLADTGFTTDPADYVQMELTPMSQWTQSGFGQILR